MILYRLDPHQYIPFVHHIPIGCYQLNNTPCHLGLNFVEDLHGLNQRNYLSNMYYIAEVNKGGEVVMGNVKTPVRDARIGRLRSSCAACPPAPGAT